MTPEEKKMIEIYERMTDEEIFQFVQNTAEELGRIPTKADLMCPWYLKERFGPWPRFMEKAGVKAVSERRKKKLEEQEQMRKRQHK
jgi:hypothetical protein